MSFGRLSGIDALGRGLANVRANWPLVPIATAASIAIAGIAIAGAIPGLALVGLSIFDLATADPFAAGGAAVPSPDFDPSALGAGAIAAAAFVFLAALLVASIVQCWVQAGLLGALWSGDAQSPPGAGRPALLFRTWSPRFFLAEANRLFFRLLAFYGALLGLLIVWLLLLLVLVLGAGAVGQGFNGGAAVAIGCGGAIPLGFLMLVLALGAAVGQADVPRPGGSALGAVRTGFRVLGARIGACALLYLLYVTGIVAVAIAQGVVGFVAGLVLHDAPALSLTVSAGLFLLQTLAQTAMTLALTAALVALVRAEATAASRAA